jgi:hypothetical protein
MQLQQLIRPITEDSSKDKIVSSTGEKKLYRAVTAKDAEKIAATNQFIPRVADGGGDMGRAVAFLSFSRSPSGQYVATQHGMQVVFEIDQEKLERHLQRQNRSYSLEPFVFGSDLESKKHYVKELETRLNLLDDSSPIGNLKKYTRAVHIFVPRDVVQRARIPKSDLPPIVGGLPQEIDPDADMKKIHKFPTPLEISQSNEQTIIRIASALRKLGIRRTHLYANRADFLRGNVHNSFKINKNTLMHDLRSWLGTTKRALQDPRKSAATAIQGAAVRAAQAAGTALGKIGK